MGRILILIGVAFILTGLLLSLLPKIPGLGRFPGDILVHKGHFTFYFPVTTCLLLSLLLTAVSWLLGRK